MKLKNLLYKTQGSETLENDVKYRIILLQDCTIYKSHFPGNPITPGVCIVQISRELLEEYIGSRLCIDEIKNAKFLSVMRPEEQIVEVLFSKIEVAGNHVKAQVNFSDVVTNYAKLTIQGTIA